VRSEAKAPLRIALWATLLIIAALGVLSAPALAVTNHVLTDSFGSPGSGNGQLKDPKGIAVDNSTGDIYVADTGNRRVSKFDSDGDFLFSWGIDVVESGPDNGVNEHQSVTAQGSGGTFMLRAPNGFDESFNRHQTVLVAGTGGSFTLQAPNGFDESFNRHQTVLVAGTGGSFTLTAPNGFNSAAPYHWQVSPGPNSTFFIQESSSNRTKDIPHAATAAELQAAIEEMNGFSGTVDSVTGPAAGPWEVTFKAGVMPPDASAGNNGVLIQGQATAAIARNASAAEVQGALESLGTIGAGNVSVSGAAGGPWDVEFIGTFAGENLPKRLEADGFNLTGLEKSASVLDGELSAPIARNASAAEVQAELESLGTIGAGNVSVTGAAGGPWDVEFTGILAAKDLPSLEADGTNLTGDPKSASVLDGEMSAAIARDASAAEVQGALEALSTLGAGNVSVTGAAGGPWDVEFTGIFAQGDVLELIGDAGGLTGDPKSVLVATTTAGGGFEICKAGIDVCKAGSGATGLPRMVTPTFVAVDNSGGPSDGAVYVGDLGSGAAGSLIPPIVAKFTPEGTYISSNDGSASGGKLGANGTDGIAVDAVGNLYIANIPIDSRIAVFSQDGVFVKTIETLNVDPGLAVDSTTNSIFSNLHGAGGINIAKQNSLTGKFWDVGDDPTATNLALDPSSSALYATFTKYVKRYDHTQNTVNLQEEFGNGDLSDATAIALLGDEFQTAYVTDMGSDEVKVFTSPVLPDPKTGEITDLGITSATLHGTVNPNGVKASYQFEYVEESAFEASGFATAAKAPIPAGEAGEGEAAIDVSEELSGLEPGTTYRWRLGAANELASALGATKSFTTPSPVTIEELFPSGVSTTSATANATINPGGAKTTYRVEYGTTEAYGKVVPVPDASAGAGTADLKVSQPLQGLKPATTYHFRFVAENIGGPVISEDETFHTFANEIPGLPDDRAWEMVSPPDKNGGSIATKASITRVADDGEAISYMSARAFADSLGTNGFGNEYISKRGPNGWSTHGITPLQIPQKFPGNSTGFVGSFSADLDKGIFLATPALEPGHPMVEDSWNLYRASNLLTPKGASLELLSDSVNPASEVSLGPDIRLAAASADYSHVLFETHRQLTAEAIGTDSALPKLYEWAAGELRLAGILPEDACGSPPCIAAGSIAGPGASELSTLESNPDTYTTHTISEDGSRVFFTAPPFSQDFVTRFGKFGTLYLREDAATTVRINASERSSPDPAGTKPAKFLDATPDGSFAFFVTAEQLNDEDTNSGYDIYRYEVGAPEGSRLTLISEDANPVGGSSTKGAYVIGTSEDGSYVYFSSQDELVSGQPGSTEKTDTDKFLYVWHDGEVRFVGAGPAFSAAWGGGGPANHRETKASTVTPDGKRIVFPSASTALAEMTAGFSSKGSSDVCEFFGGPAPDTCQEIYTYDYDSDERVCISCNEAGEAVGGNAFSVAPFVDTGPGEFVSQHISRTISDDGRWVFFSSPDRLVARDSNGRYDAYRYDTSSGKVALLSSGSCNCDSYFVEISADGKDAFFTTRERLVAIDVDNDADLYDARVGGGIAAQNVVPQPQCEGDACMPPVAVPNFPTPASAGFKGQGNVKSSPNARKRCATGKVRRGRRCIPKRSLAKRACKKKSGQAKRRCMRTSRNRGGAK
jgi:NHL repeat